MKKDNINISFLAALNIKSPNRTKLANYLVSILQIEKEAVYRRLRGEVPFTFGEVAIISERLGISLDNVVGIENHKDRPFVFKLSDFDDPHETDYNMWKNYIDVLKLIIKNPFTETVEVCNNVPYPITYKYPLINKFIIFKWRYQFKSNAPVKSYEEMILKQKQKELQDESLYHTMQISDTSIIFDPAFINNLIRDILYFYNIRLISFDSLKELKEELLEFINYLEFLANTGEYEETNKKINIYISNITLDTSYNYIETSNFHLSQVKTLTLSSIVTTDEVTFKIIKGWVNALKRMSTLISVSGERQRIDFFNEQRKIINTL